MIDAAGVLVDGWWAIAAESAMEAVTRVVVGDVQGGAGWARSDSRCLVENIFVVVVVARSYTADGGFR